MMRIGPIYDLEDGLRLQDVDGACPNCFKRLAECIHDPSGQWNAGQLVCIDCSTVASWPTETPARQRVVLRSSWRAHGLRVACCTLCPRTSMPLPADRAAQWAVKHLTEAHTPDAAA